MMANNDLEETIHECIHLQEFMEAQKDLILEHINEHKYFKHIPDYNKGVVDFIQEYGWLYRELICKYTCTDRFKCDLAKKYHPKLLYPPK